MSSDNGGRAKATLFVRGLPHDATNDQLEAFFSEVGPVRSCFVVMENLPEDKKDVKRLNKGYGFVQYAIPEDATRAIEELKNKKFREERILRMELALKKNTSSSEKKIAISKDQVAKNKNIKNKIKEYSSTVKPRLIIRNLSFFCKKHHLQKAFEKFGTLDYIDVPTKPGREDLGRGYGFVGFINEKDAEKAMNEMNGQKILGRTVAIDWSVPRALYKQIEEENKEKEDNEEDNMDVDEEENEEDGDDNEEKEEDGDDDDEENEDEEEEAENDEDDEDDGIKVIMDDEEEEEEDEDDEDDDDDDDDDEEDEEEDDEDEDDKKYPEVEEKRTLFIRNLSFDTDQDSLYEKFKVYGPISYARITKDYETGKSRGTGFVCFHKKEDAEKCLKAYEEAEKHAYEFEDQQQQSKGKKKESTIHSVLRPEPMLNDATAPFILDGRFLKVNIAVRRGEAEQLINATKIKKRKEDTRNMYLIREGVIFPDSDLGKQINQSELSKRITSYTSRKQMLAKNPNLFISKTRLSIRNLIPSIDDKTLKQKARESVTGFWKDVQNNKRKTLEDYVIDEEKASGHGAPGLKRKIVIKQAKILRSKDRIDNETKLGRSKGCGFVEFGSHADALACLRYMNNNSKIFPGMSKRTPIVEFAVENRIILKRREDRMNKKNKREQLAKANANNEDENTVNILNNKRKRGEEKKNKKNKKNDKSKDTTENPPSKKQKVDENTAVDASANESKKSKKKKNNKKNKKANKEEASDKPVVTETKVEATTPVVEKKDKKKDKKKEKKKSKREQKEAKEDKQFNDLIKLHGKSNLIKGSTDSSSLLKGTDFSGMKKWFE